MKLIDTEKLLKKAGFISTDEIEYKTDECALIIGKEGYILTDNEFIHCLMKIDEEAYVSVRKSKKGFICFSPPYYTLKVTLNELKELQTTEVDVKKWGHYFGIKSRICGNYNLLKKSIKEIKANVELPDWKQMK